MKPTSALTTAQRDALKTARATAWFYARPDTVVATLTVTSALNTLEGRVNVSGSLSNVTADMTAKVKRGSNLVGYYRIRKVGGSELYLGADVNDKGLFQFGQALPPIAANDTIEVLDRYDLAAKIPRIDTGASVIYEDYDIAYSDQNTTPAPYGRVWIREAANGAWNTHYGGFTSGSTIDLDIRVEADSFVSGAYSFNFTFPVSWVVLSSNTTATVAERQVRVPIGAFSFTCTITQNAKTRTLTRYVVVDDRVNPTLFKELLDFSAEFTTDGVRLSGRLRAQDAQTYLSGIPQGAFSLIALDTEQNPAFSRVYTGFFDGGSYTSREAERAAQIAIFDASEILRRVYCASQLFERKSTVDTWQKLPQALSHPAFAVYWLLDWRVANYHRLFNFEVYSAASDYKAIALKSDRGSVWQAIQAMTGRLPTAILCASADGLRLDERPELLSATARNAIITRYTLTEDDVASLNISVTQRTRYRRARLAAFLPVAADDEKPIPIRSGATAINGEQEQDIDGLLALSQAELNRVSGDTLAALNAPYERIQYELIGALGMAFMPYHQQFVGNNIAQAYHELFSAAFTQRCIPISLSLTVEAGGVVRTSLTVKPETDGADGVTLPIPIEGEYSIVEPFELPPYELPPIELDLGEPLTYDPATLMPIGENGSNERGRFFLLTKDNRVIRVTFDGNGNPQFADISPDVNIRNALGQSEMLQAYWQSPERLYIMGRDSFAMTPNARIAAPSWIEVKNVNPANSKQIVVTFGAGSYPYTLVQNAAIDYSSGNPPPCVSRAANPMVFRIDLGASRSGAFTVILDFFRPDFISSSTLNWVARDASLNNIGTGSIGATAPVPNQWNTSDPANFSGSNVRYIDITATIGAGFGSGIYRFDNIKITYPVSQTGKFDGKYDFASLPSANQFCWLGVRVINGQPTIVFYKTANAFQGVYAVPIAKEVANMTYGIAFNPHNDKEIYITAGDPADGSGAVYKSVNGGLSFVKTSVPLATRGGAIHWNWSTQTTNTPNTSESNLRAIEGVVGSNIVLRRGFTNTSNVTNNTGNWLRTRQGLQFAHIDLDFGFYTASNGNVFRSTDSGVTWSAGATVTGGSGFYVNGAAQYPLATNFLLIFGYRCLGYSTNGFTSYTSLWNAYDTWRAANLGATVGEEIVSAVVDIGYAVKR
jgi:hypothetical protein